MYLLWLACMSDFRLNSWNSKRMPKSRFQPRISVSFWSCEFVPYGYVNRFLYYDTNVNACDLYWCWFCIIEWLCNYNELIKDCDWPQTILVFDLFVLQCSPVYLNKYVESQQNFDQKVGFSMISVCDIHFDTCYNSDVITNEYN